MSETDRKFPFFLLSLSDFDINVMLALLNEWEKIPFFPILWNILCETRTICSLTLC